MNKNKSNDRRKLLKSVAVGSGTIVAAKSLPEAWSKPIIDSVVLPAHAATTDDAGTLTTDITTTTAPCCNIEGLFCGPIENTDAFIDINVTADGTVTISILGGTPTVTSVPCSGGTFSALVSQSTVTGTVTCDGSLIEGTTDLGSYSAIIDQCGSALIPV